MTRLNAVLESHRENISEKILELVLSGDGAAAIDELRAFEATFPPGTADPRIRINRAIIGVFGDDMTRVAAREDLEELAKLGDLSTKSLLVASYYLSSSEWEYWRNVGELDDHTPKKFQEFLFRGFAFSFGFPQQAVEDLEKAKDLDPASPLARVLLARACRRMSLLTPDKALSRSYAERSVQEADIAKEIMSRVNPLAASTRVYAYARLLDCLLSGENAADEMEIQSCSRVLTSEIKESLDGPYDWQTHYAQMAASMVLSKHGIDLESKFDQQIWMLPALKSRTREITVRMVQHHYRNENLDLAASIIADNRDALTPFAIDAVLPEIEHEYESKGSLAPMTRRYLPIMTDENRVDKGLNGSIDWTLLKLLGEHDKAQRRASDFLTFVRAFQENLPGGLNLVPIAEHISGTQVRTPDELFDVADDNHEIVFTAYWLGIEELSRGRRDKAKEMFQRVVDTNCGNFFAYEWARMFLERIDDQKWLPWLLPDASPQDSGDDNDPV